MNLFSIDDCKQFLRHSLAKAGDKTFPAADMIQRNRRDSLLLLGCLKSVALTKKLDKVYSRFSMKGQTTIVGKIMKSR